MTEDIKISVIVPAYNNAPWLSRCLDSLLSQTYRNLEIIVVDDGSGDNTQEILRRYHEKDPRVHPFYQENGGVTSARLHGIREASGDWIGFVDGDDAVDADMYERLLSNALEYHADISHCGYRMVFEDGRINYFHNTGRLYQHDRNEALRELLSGAMIEPGLCNKLFRGELFREMLKSPALDPSIKINEDLLMNFILFSLTKQSVFEDFCPYQYIVRSNSASRQKLNDHQIYDPIRVKQRIMDIAPEQVRREAQAAYLSTCINVYNSLAITDQKGLKENRQKIRDLIVESKKFTTLISKKQQILAGLIRYLPWMYSGIYGIYYRYFLKNPYV